MRPLAGVALAAAFSLTSCGSRVEDDGTRWVENPLVNIRSRLLEQSEDVMFTVNTTAAPEYWRMASLHEFNGEQWSTADNYASADAGLASGLPEDLGNERMNQKRSRSSVEWSRLFLVRTGSHPKGRSFSTSQVGTCSSA